VLSSEFEAFLGEINKVKVEEMIDILENGSYSLEYGVLKGDKNEVVYSRKNMSKEDVMTAIEDFKKDRIDNLYLKVYRHHYQVEITEDTKTCIFEDKYWGGKQNKI
jgi:hypothetical protein